METDGRGVGRVFISHDDMPPEQQVWVRSLEGTGIEPATYAALQESAHLWINADYEHDLWTLIGVEYAAAVGIDHVVLPFRFGNSTYQLAHRPDLWDQIPQFAAMRDLFQKNRDERRKPRDILFANLLAPHILVGSLEAVFWARDSRFTIIDLCATEDDLCRWQSLSAADGGE